MWDALMSGKSAISEIPDERWPTDTLLHPTRGEPGRSVSFAAGVIEDAFLFDAAFFNISPREASWMDPQQRLLLQMTHEALDDAGLSAEKYRGSGCGVYLGISGMDYGQNALIDLPSISPHTMTGNTLSIAANRISYVFDLRGPSLAIDTACSSSLAAIHQACQALNSGAAPMAVAGGINMLMHPYPFIGFSQAAMLSPSGRCRPFDAAGDGYVRGEGGGLLVLKPLAAALADGDRIHAVIVGSGVNSDGAGKKGLTIPSPSAQTELMTAALAKSGLEPDDLSYVEAHGTGTPVGDPAEALSIGAAYGKRRSSPLPISSAKANFGHLEPASGMAGLIKAVISLKRGRVPPMPFDFNPNPDIDFEGLNIRCAARGEALKAPEGRPLAAAVNSFGFGGLNAHILLRQCLPDESPINRAPEAGAEAGPLPPLMISAKSQASLEALAGRYADLLESLPEESFYNIAWNAAFRRAPMEKRLALTGGGKAERAQALRDYSEGKNSRLICAETALPGPGRAAFVYSGNGAQWRGMGRQLYQESAVFAEMFDRVDAEMSALSGWSAREMLFEGSEEDFQDTAKSQPLLFAIQAALTVLLEEMGVRPEAALGHSVGEVAAAWAVKSITLGEAVKIILARSEAQGRTRGLGRMAAAGLGADEAKAEIRRLGLEGKAEIAAANSPRNCTLSGDLDALKAIEKVFKEKGVFFRMLDLDYAFHSRRMDPALDFLEEALAGLAPSPRAEGLFISTVEGRPMSGRELGPAYWRKNMRQPVRFDKGIKALADLGFNIFLEIGPHAILQRYIRENLNSDAQARVMPSLQQSAAGLERARQAAASVILLAPKATLPHLFPRKAPWTPLPAYPWNLTSYSFPITPERTPLPAKTRPLAGWRLSGPQPVWEAVFDPLKDLWLADHKVGGSVVFPAAAYIEAALEAAAQWREGSPPALENFDILLPLVFENNKAQILRCEINADDGSFSVLSRARMEDGPWLAHVRGRILTGGRKAPKPSLEAVSAPDKLVGKEELYKAAERLGLEYGPFFRRIAAIAVKGGLLEAALEDYDDGAGYVLHPGAADACFHSLAAIYADEGEGEACLPTGFGRLKIYSSDPVKRIRGAITRLTKRTLRADFELLDKQGGLIAKFSDCRFRRLPSIPPSQAVDSWLYRRLMRPPAAQKGALKLDPAAAARALELKPDKARLLWHREVLPRLEASVMAFAMDLIKSGANLSDNLSPALAGWIRNLARLSESPEEAPDWKELWREAHDLAPSFLPALLPAARAMNHIAEAAKKGAPPLEAEPEQIARENSALNPAYSGIDNILDEFLDKLLKGAGWTEIAEAAAYYRAPDPKTAAKIENGSLALTLALPEDASSPQPSSANIILASDPLEWLGREKRPFDALIFRQILHKAPDLKSALETAFSSLKPGGTLLIAERHPDWSADLASGLINDGFWREDQDGGAVSPRMRPESWLELLKSAGFEDLGLISEPEAEGLAEGAYLIYGRKGGQDLDEPGAAPAALTLLHDSSGEALAKALAERLAENGASVELGPIGGLDASAADSALIIYGKGRPAEDAPAALAALNSLLLKRPLSSETWLVTHGAYPAENGAASPFHAALAGYARAARMERRGLDLRLRDLDPDLPLYDAASALYEELAGGAPEDELCLSSAGRHIFSLRKGRRGAPRGAERVRLDILQPGRLDSLAWVKDEKKALGDDEIEARVMAAGLNFRDIMLAMGLLPEDAVENGFAGPSLGLEFSGVVTAAGKNVKNPAPGDRVAGFAPACFASHVRAPAASVTGIPPELDFTGAAAVPTIFITAWYALKHLAGLSGGERLLIHGGAGGVGLAAIQIARLLGAEIFATAGTKEKRDYLRLLGADHVLDSRSLDFADEITALTKGEGVDVVLNSLAGEAMRRSMALLKPFGRFLELGKRDYVENTTIGLRPFKENISYFSIDVDQLLTARPDLARSLFEEVMENLRRGRLIPPPLKVFGAARIEEAFRTMQQSRHMGKVVADMADLPPAAGGGEKADYSGVWLVSGGASGFGLETARHLARNGAKTLVLASRRGENISGAREIKEEFAALGAEAILKSCDFSEKTEVEGLIEWIKLNLPPLTGVVHAAAVFDDRRLEDLDEASFARSLRPKMLGALYLHEAARNLPLKHFILFSSISAALGNPGQANYTAANFALEALADLRVSQNLPASCLAWGPISGSGYLSRNEAVQKSLSMQLGKPPLTVPQAMAAFDAFAGENGVHVLANINWRRALEFAEKTPIRLEEAFRQSAAENENDISSDFAASLIEMGEAEALESLKRLIASEAAKVLGMDAAQTPHDRSLQAMGLDSLMAMELALSLRQATGLRLPPMLLQDAPTIGQLAQRIWERLEKPAGEASAEEAMLEELAMRHSEELKEGDIQKLLSGMPDKRP